MFRQALIASTIVVLAACGTTPGERGVSGGVLGAAGGAAIGSLTGNAGAGAVIGGVGGAAAGLLTTPPQPSGPQCIRWSPYTGRCAQFRQGY
jgi:osmotically inducible lipoprotein OsmB